MPGPTAAEASSYDRFIPMLEAQHSEFTKLSGKKQDGPVNKLKVRNVNRLLNAIEPLVHENPSRPYLEFVEEETLTENSDVLLILSQWLAVLKQYKADNYGYDPGTHEHRWFTREKPRSKRL